VNVPRVRRFPYRPITQPAFKFTRTVTTGTMNGPIKLISYGPVIGNPWGEPRIVPRPDIPALPHGPVQGPARP
jgi:hypothetical protein